MTDALSDLRRRFRYTHVALFHADEGPDFVALDPLARQAVHNAILIQGACLAYFRQEL